MKIPPLIRHILVTGIASTIVSGISYLIGIYLARMLGTSGRGELAVLINSLNILYPLTALGVQQAGAYMISREGWSVELVRSLHSRIIPASSALTFLAFFSVMTLSGDRQLQGKTLLLIAAIIPARLFYEYRSGIFLSSKRLVEFSASQLARIFLEGAATVVAFTFHERSIENYLSAILLSYVTATAFQAYLLKSDQQEKRTPSMDEVFKIIRKGIVFALPLLIMGLNYNTDIFMLSAMGIRSERIGLYAVAVTLSTLVWFLPQFINLTVFSHALNLRGAASRKLSMNMLKYSLILLVFMSATITVAALTIFEDIIVFIYGPLYTGAADLFYLLAPGTLAMLLYKMLNGNLAARGHPDIALKVFGPVSVVNIILNWWWIPIYMEYGAAMASSISYVIGATIYVFIYLRLTVKALD